MKKILILLGLLSFTTLFNCSLGDSILGDDPSGENELLAFSFQFGSNVSLTRNVDGIIDSSGSVVVTIPPTVLQGDLTQLVATIRVSEKATVFVGTIEQESGITPNDFSRIVQYRVVAENGEEAFYNVTVNNVLNEENSFLSFQFLAENNADLNQDVSATIDADNNIIVEFPIRAYSGDFTDLTASFEISNRSNTFVDDVVQVSGETVNDFVNTVNYTVTAEDGTEANYSVTVTNLLNFENSILSFELSSDLNPGIFRTFPTGTNIDESIIRFHNCLLYTSDAADE